MSFIINLQANITFNKSWKYNPWLFLVNQIMVIVSCSLKMNEDILMNRNILNICKILERMEVPLKYYIEKVKNILFQMLVIISNMVLFFFPKLALWEMGEGSPIISIFQWISWGLEKSLCDIGHLRCLIPQMVTMCYWWSTWLISSWSLTHPFLGSIWVLHCKLSTPGQSSFAASHLHMWIWYLCFLLKQFWKIRFFWHISFIEGDSL